MKSAVPVAAQDRFVYAAGPIGRSIETEAARLAAVETRPDADDLAWASLQQIERDTDVEVLDRTGTVRRGQLAEVNDASVRLRKGVLSTWIVRGDVVKIATWKGGRSPAGAAGGVALGILVAVFIAPAIGLSELLSRVCGRHMGIARQIFVFPSLDRM
jgi:hypothetical protein